MLKISFHDNGDKFTIKILENDAGKWKVAKKSSAELCHFSLVGYGGENIITIHLMGMQDGSYDIVAVHSSVDNTSEVYHQLFPRIGFNETSDAKLNKALNTAIGRVYNVKDFT